MEAALERILNLKTTQLLSFSLTCFAMIGIDWVYFFDPVSLEVARNNAPMSIALGRRGHRYNDRVVLLSRLLCLRAGRHSGFGAGVRVDGPLLARHPGYRQSVCGEEPCNLCQTDSEYSMTI